MKILKQGKVEMRKFVCPKCGCIFVANEVDFNSSDSTVKIKCPCCWQGQRWDKGEPYEESTQDARMDSNRLARILFAMPTMDDCNSMANYLIQRGVTFREG